MATHAVVHVYPYPLKNLVVSNGSSTLTMDSMTDTGSCYEFEIGTAQWFMCGELTFKADGYLNQSRNCYTDALHEITLVKKMYAWSGSWIDGDHTFYTLNETPTTNDRLYHANGNVVGLWEEGNFMSEFPIESVSENEITVRYSNSG